MKRDNMHAPPIYAESKPLEPVLPVETPPLYATPPGLSHASPSGRKPYKYEAALPFFIAVSYCAHRVGLSSG